MHINAEFKMTDEQKSFHKALLSVSIQIADWAKGQFEIGASVTDVKQRLRKCAEIANR